METQKIILKTDDGINLVADFYDSASGNEAVIFLHQNGQDRHSWDGILEVFLKTGFAVLNMDLRGHGESDLRLSGFAPQDYRRMTKDVEAGISYLREQGKTMINIVGSSIGANLAIITLAEQPVSIAKIIALSPGFQYKGLDAEESSRKLSEDFIADKPRILLVASSDDAYSFETVKKFFGLLGSRAELVEYPHGGHGLSLLAFYPELPQKMVEFLNA